MQTLKTEETACCGVVCSDCEYYPHDCKGCRETKAHPFWLQYVEFNNCEIYQCCVEVKKLKHCGGCLSLPCEFYTDDPTKSKEENEKGLQKQLELLKSLS